jgi:hypothetical protein
MAKPLVEVAISADGSVFVREVDKATSSAKKLQTQVKDAGDASDKWTKQLGTSAVAIAKWGSATAAAAAVGSALFIKSAIDQADAANILAGKLGITTEALTKLQYAAMLSDVSQQTLEGGLRKLATTLTVAQDPASKTAKALLDLGLSARELIAIPADQQLGRIGDALNNVQNQSQRAALAQQIFGKAGQALLPILAEGTAGIKNFGDEAERTGVVIDSTFAARAGVFNDNIDRIKSAVTGLGLNVAEELLPRLEELQLRIISLANDPEVTQGLADLFSGIINLALDAAEAIGKTATALREVDATRNFERESASIEALGEQMDELAAKRAQLADRSQPLGMLASAVPGVNSLFSENAASIAQIDESIKSLGERREKALQVVADFLEITSSDLPRKRIVDQEAAVRSLTGALTGSTTETNAAAKAAENQAAKIKDTIEQLQFEAQQITKTAREQRIAIALRNAGATAATAEGRSISQLTALLFDHEESLKRNKAALDEMDRGMADLEAGLDKTATKSDPWADALEGAVQRVDSSFVDMWKNIGSGFDSFADSLKDAFKQLLAELANLAITRPIVMRFASALGLGGSASALASGGGGGGLGGIASLFSAGKSALKGFQSGGLGGGINGLIGGSETGGMLGDSLSSFRFALGDLSSKLGLDGLAGKFNSQGLEINSTGANLLDLGANIGAGFLGSLAGDKIGSALFGDRKTTGIGSGIGGTIGSAWGPVGTFIGSTLGSIAENAIGKIFGAGDLVKFGKLGITTGGGSNIPNDGSALKTITAASGLQLSAVAKRTDKDAALQLLDGFSAIDSTLTELSRAAGITVDFAGKVLGNTSLNVDNEGPLNSFGVGARLDKFNAEKIKTSADDFARAWISEIDDQLTGRIKQILGDTSKRTAEQIVQIFGFASKLDQLLKIDVLAEVSEAAATKMRTLLDVYGEATDAVVNLAQEYDGSLESMTSLTDALQSQKQVAAQLAVAYEEVSRLVDATFGNAISTIEESMLSEADLYQRRRSQIASLTAELSTTIDPTKIAGLVQQIDALAGSAFQMLDEGQRKQMSQEFVDFLTQAQTIADAQIQAGRDSLAGRETATANAIDLEVLNTAALTQQAAANTFAAAVTQFAGVMGGGFNLDPVALAAAIAAARGEVNA